VSRGRGKDVRRWAPWTPAAPAGTGCSGLLFRLAVDLSRSSAVRLVRTVEPLVVRGVPAALPLFLPKAVVLVALSGCCLHTAALMPVVWTISFLMAAASARSADDR
jgi:hypothetical protein